MAQSRTAEPTPIHPTVRVDGNIVTDYYYATKDLFENHLEATLWSP